MNRMPNLPQAMASERAMLLPSPMNAMVRPFEVAELLAHGHQIGHGLARMAVIGQAVDDGDGGVFGQVRGFSRARKFGP